MNDAQPPTEWDQWPKAAPYGVTKYISDRDEIGLYLLVEGEVIRYRLSGATARWIAATLSVYLARSQSPTSSGSPSVDVSTPDEGVNV